MAIAVIAAHLAALQILKPVLAWIDKAAVSIANALSRLIARGRKRSSQKPLEMRTGHPCLAAGLARLVLQQGEHAIALRLVMSRIDFPIEKGLQRRRQPPAQRNALILNCFLHFSPDMGGRVFLLLRSSVPVYRSNSFTKKLSFGCGQILICATERTPPLSCLARSGSSRIVS